MSAAVMVGAGDRDQFIRQIDQGQRRHDGHNGDVAQGRSAAMVGLPAPVGGAVRASPLGSMSGLNSPDVWRIHLRNRHNLLVYRCLRESTGGRLLAAGDTATTTETLRLA